MKTLLIAPEIFARDGGIQRILRLYLKALCDDDTPGTRVGFIALNDLVVDDKELRDYTRSQLVFWLVCSGDKRRFVKSTLKNSGYYNRILCGHIAQLPVAMASKILHPFQDYYLIAHGIEVWGKMSLIKRLALRMAKKVICVSEFTRSELIKGTGINPAKCVVLHNALDLSFVIAPGVPNRETAPTILTITRLTHSDRYKGVDHLIEAMPGILEREPAAQLRIIGRGDDLPRLQRLANKLGLQNDSVRFLGYVDDEAMVKEIASCRLFSLPSRDEGFGLVYLEAMARGRPCLAVRAGAASEVVTAETGVFANFGDIPSIVAATVDGLRRDWNEEIILDRARSFSYSRFREGLNLIMHK